MSIFTSNKDAFREAFNANNVPGLRALTGKKVDPYWLMFDRSSAYKDMPAETLRFFAELPAAAWTAWWPYSGKPGTPEENKKSVINGMAILTIGAKRTDLLNIVLDQKHDLNSGDAQSHLINHVICSDLPEPEKCALLRRFLDAGTDKIANTGLFLHNAAAQKFIQGIDLLAAAGFNVHADDELLLRNAAKAGQANLCQHLIAAHNCDRDLAAATARRLGNTADAGWLETFAAAGGDGKPPTVESLSAEVRELKAAYRELAAQLLELRMPEKRLDKPALPSPAAPKASAP